MRHHHITVRKTARYVTLGPPTGAVREVWFACHGYGQLASRFLRPFRALDDGSRLIVAPEGLLRFYVDHEVGKVGASWMTKEDRESEIADYVRYLDDLSAEIFRRVPRSGARVVVLGFSQGASTVSRWIHHGRVDPDHVILWAGDLPPELTSAEDFARFRRVQTTLVAGNDDRIVPPAVMEKQLRRLEEQGAPARLLRFDGVHEIEPVVLQDLSDSST